MPRGVSDLTFPALMLARDNSITAVPFADALGRCNALAFFRHHFYDGLMILDADLRLFTVLFDWKRRVDAAPDGRARVELFA